MQMRARLYYQENACVHSSSWGGGGGGGARWSPQSLHEGLRRLPWPEAEDSRHQLFNV